MEFERPIKKDGLRVGQTLRILLKNQLTDLTGFVLERRKQWVRVRPTESKSDDDHEFKLSDIVSATEIMYSPLFYRLRQFVAGERVGKKIFLGRPVENQKNVLMTHPQNQKCCFTLPLAVHISELGTFRNYSLGQNSNTAPINNSLTNMAKVLL